MAVCQGAEWRDDFESSVLDDVWQWVREDSSKWNLRSGSMQITTQQGGILFDTDNARNLLVREGPSGDFTIETYVEFEPDADYQKAGLLIYEDDGSFLLFCRAHCGSCGGNMIFFDYEENGTRKSSGEGYATTSRNRAYLKVEKKGSTYSGYYSTNGADWQLARQYRNVGVRADYVGIATTGSLNWTSNVARFDYFSLDGSGVTTASATTTSTTTTTTSTAVTTPVAVDDSGGRFFDSFTRGIGSPWHWENEDPSHWQITPDGSLRVTLQDSSWFPSQMRNLLLRPAPSGSTYTIETHLLFEPDAEYQMAGLILLADDGNLLEALRQYAEPKPGSFSKGNSIAFIHFADGVMVPSNHVSVPTKDEIYLRAVIDDETYSIYYSEDGEGWQMLDFGRFLWDPVWVGLCTSSGDRPVPPGKHAEFSYFAMEEGATEITWAKPTEEQLAKLAVIRQGVVGSSLGGGGFACYREWQDAWAENPTTGVCDVFIGDFESACLCSEEEQQAWRDSIPSHCGVTYRGYETCGNLCWVYSYGMYDNGPGGLLARFERCYCSSAELDDLDKARDDWEDDMRKLGYIEPDYWYSWTINNWEPCHP